MIKNSLMRGDLIFNIKDMIFLFIIYTSYTGKLLINKASAGL